MRLKSLSCAAAAFVAMSMAITPAAFAQNSAGMESMPMTRMDSKSMEHMIASWPQASQMAAHMAMEKYGPPAETTASMLIWNKSGQWKRTVVYNYEVSHDFPMHHTDVMQQFIDYRVSPDMVEALAKFDGSVVVNRTNGEISARCDALGANILAINLANQIVTGKMSVAEARKTYGEQIMAMKAGRPAPMTEQLNFTVPMGGTADPDKPLHAM